MDVLTRIKQTLKTADTRELLLYLGSVFAALTLIMALLVYVHLRRRNYYIRQLGTIDQQRKKTRTLISDYKFVTQRQTEVEEILNKDKNFRIEPVYTQVLQKLGLLKNQPEEPTATSTEEVKGTTERVLTSHLSNMSMRQLTELLSALADIKQIYPKELTITKVPNTQAVTVDLTIATLQPENNL
jgi:hypothetical protein